MKKTINQNISLHSLHSLDECYQRLNDSVDPLKFRSLFGKKKVIGRVSKTSIRIRKRIKYENSFQPVLTATLRSDANGTKVSGRIGMPLDVKVVMCLYFAIIGSVFIVSVLSHILDGEIPKGSDWMFVILPPIMIIFGFGLLKFGKYLARNEPLFLINFLIDLLDAKEIETVIGE